MKRMHVGVALLLIVSGVSAADEGGTYIFCSTRDGLNQVVNQIVSGKQVTYAFIYGRGCYARNDTFNQTVQFQTLEVDGNVRKVRVSDPTITKKTEEMYTTVDPLDDYP